MKNLRHEMNPVTRGLLKQINDPDLRRFAESWDQLEHLVIEIYRQKSVSSEQQVQFLNIKEVLAESYPSLEKELATFWPRIKVKGELVVGDPFAALIEKENAKEFVENWKALRTLPAAREALNQMLVARIEQGKDK